MLDAREQKPQVLVTAGNEVDRRSAHDSRQSESASPRLRRTADNPALRDMFGQHPPSDYGRKACIIGDKERRGPQRMDFTSICYERAFVAGEPICLRVDFS